MRGQVELRADALRLAVDAVAAGAHLLPAGETVLHAAERYYDFMVNRPPKADVKPEEKTKGLSWMEVVKAIDSGRSARRPGWATGYRVYTVAPGCVVRGKDSVKTYELSLNADDFLADDWELLP